MWLFIAAVCLIQHATNAEELRTKRHLNPQEFMTVGEVIQYWGYCNEQYEILTDDGYYLQINRIPYGIHTPGMKGPKPVILLVHGLMMEGRTWLANSPSNSLGFVLADAGYDVWILNVRGSTWSRRHQNLSIDQEEFWDFSFHEMGIYDIPAAINFILQKTEQEQLYYIGFSQGATMGLIAFSTIPELGQKVKLFIALGPAYTLTNSSGLLYRFILVPGGLRKLIWGNKEYCIFSNGLKKNIAKSCSFALMDRLCLEFIFLSFGFNEKNLNVSRADVYLGIFPDFTSVKTIDHWGQIAISNEFKYFDYGSKNKAIYNMTTPPFYRIEDITVPTAVWSAGKDYPVDETNTELLVHQIPHVVFYKNIPDWQHTDYIWGLDAPLGLYPDMLALMEKEINTAGVAFQLINSAEVFSAIAERATASSCLLLLQQESAFLPQTQSEGMSAPGEDPAAAMEPFFAELLEITLLAHGNPNKDCISYNKAGFEFRGTGRFG